MLFNSFEFLLFFPIVFLLYWFVFSKNKSTQNIFLLISSYIFYSFWDWRFSFLLAFSTILDYSSGIIIDNATSFDKKKFWMRLSIITNIGLLCYFKYFNFFIESFVSLFNPIGFKADIHVLNIILPIGISFYTFHGVSYVLDIYYGRIKAHRDIVDYSLFVSYFPLLVAGPIERATHLLPQLKEKREFKYSQGVEGCRLILWGMFKKVVIADSLAPLVNDIFDNYQNYNGITLILGIVGFAFQVYGDFSGYTDIARGVSKLLGIELILNFNYPYFSKSIPEFWSRWHISLSSWLNDYVFTPLALKYRNFGKHGIFIAVFITFIISGLWHGAAWHFIAWGAYHGLLYIPSIYSKKGLKSMVKKKNEDALSLKDLPKILLTFTLVCFGYLLFRAQGLSDFRNYLCYIFANWDMGNSSSIVVFKIVFFALILLLIELLHLNKINRFTQYKFVMYIILNLIIALILYALIISSPTNFIYFKF